MLEYEERMTFFKQNDKRTYCLLTDYNFRQNDKRTYCLMTDYNFRQNDKRTYFYNRF